MDDTKGEPRPFGPYDLLAELGRGGAGVVYEARHRQLERRCAVKLLHARVIKPKQRQRFLEEGRLTARIGRHPHIVQVFDAGFVDNVPYLAMEYVEGMPLSDLLERDGALDETVVLDIGRSVALALDHAHRCGVVHRDVKPGNIIVDSDGEPRVLDFGLARDLTSSDLSSGFIVGTPAYLPPEQADDRFGVVDRRADVYSLGATLHHALSADLPFKAPSVRGTIQKVLLEPPPNLARVGVSAPVRAVIGKAMRKHARHRYQTALELADDLSRVLSGEPPRSQPLSPVERLFAWIRRHQALTTIVAVVVLTTLAVGSWYAYARNEAALLWQNLSNEMASATADEARDFLQPALPVLRELNTLARHGVVDTSSPDTLFKPLAARFLERPNFDWLGFGRADGDYIGMKRGKRGEALFNRSSARRGQMRETTVAPTTLVETPFRNGESSYDPRTRPFYSLGTKSAGAAWMPPYPFFEAGEGWGITAVLALRGGAENGDVRGVFHVDFKLNTLSRFLRSLDLGEGGRAYLLTTTADAKATTPVVAGPAPEDSDAQPPATVAAALGALGHPLDRLTVGKPAHVQFDTPQTHYHAAFEAFEVGGGLKWVTLITVPTATLGLSAKPLTITLVAALGLLVLIGLWSAGTTLRRRTLRQRQASARADHFKSLQDTRQDTLPAISSNLEETVSILDLPFTVDGDQPPDGD